MNGICAAVGGDLKQLVDAEIRFAGRGRTDGIGLVRLAHVQSGAINFGVDRNRAHPQLAAGANYAHHHGLQ